jgi:hypothetical protein
MYKIASGFFINDSEMIPADFSLEVTVLCKKLGFCNLLKNPGHGADLSDPMQQKRWVCM